MANVNLTLPVSQQTVRHGWYTVLQTNNRGSEKRSAIYSFPRIEVQTKVPCYEENTSQWMRYNLFRRTDETWAIPVWVDATDLTTTASGSQAVINCDTTYRNHIYANRQIVVLDKDDFTNYEIKTIDSKTDSSITFTTNLTYQWEPSTTTILPIIDMRLDTRLTLNRRTVKYDWFRVETREAYEDTRGYDYTIPTISSWAPTYSGTGADKYVFVYNPIAEMAFRFEKPYNLAQWYGIGHADGYYQDRQTNINMNQRYLFNSREQISNVFDFFDYHQGRLISFWCPTWSKDITLTDGWSASDTVINATGQAENNVNNDIINRHVMFRLPGSNYQFRQISSANSTTVTLDRQLGTAVSAANIGSVEVCYINFVRFDVDDIAMTYVSPNPGIAYCDLWFHGFVEETS